MKQGRRTGGPKQQPPDILLLLLDFGEEKSDFDSTDFGSIDGAAGDENRGLDCGSIGGVLLMLCLLSEDRFLARLNESICLMLDSRIIRGEGGLCGEVGEGASWLRRREAMLLNTSCAS